MAPPTDSTLLDYMTSSMKSLQETQQLDNKGRKVLKWLRKLKCANYKAETRFIAAQWMIVYHTMSAMAVQTPQQLEALQKQTKPDMQVAWNLLDCAHEPERELTANIFMLDVAQRLEDPVKLHTMFTSLTSRAPIPLQAAMVAFTVAPTLGDWKTFMRLGRLIEKEGGYSVTLKQFHMMAENLGMPDFALLYDNVEALKLEETKPVPDHKSLIFDTLDFHKVTFTFKSVKCKDDEAKEEELRKQLEAEEKQVDMEDLPKSGVCIKIGGCVANMISISEVPICLAGPYIDDDNLAMEGYHDLMVQPLDGSPEQMQMQMMQMAQMGQMQGAPPDAMMAGEPGGGPMGGPPPDGMFAGGQMAGPGPQMDPSMMAQMEAINKSLQANVIRQHERVDLRKCEDGYQGTYVVKNYKPYLEKGKKDPDNVAITFDIKIKCKHPKASTKKIEEEEKTDSVEESTPADQIVTEIDGLTLD